MPPVPAHAPVLVLVPALVHALFLVPVPVRVPVPVPVRVPVRVGAAALVLATASPAFAQDGPASRGFPGDPSAAPASTDVGTGTGTGVGVGVGAAASSDLVHVLDADGLSHVLQHTVAADGTALTLELPGSVVPQRVLFMGAGRERWERRRAERPRRISIGPDGSGGALVRYRHRYGDEVVDAGDGRFVLSARSVPEALDVEPAADGSVPDFESVVAWVFPADVRVEAWRVEGTDAPGPTRGADGDGHGTEGGDGFGAGAWSFEDNVLTWSQRGLAAVTLEIEYALPAPSAEPAGASAEPAATSDGVASVANGPAGTPPDVDADGVPDARDVCLWPTDPTSADAADVDADGDETVGAGIAELGCPAAARLVLPSIAFPTGRARLDLPARRTLDRLAAALEAGDGEWEIAAHTDAEGPESRNLALSVRRAESVRHYLMLRGVEPNRLAARGYGEADPIADDATAAGRAANRRVELRRATVGDAPAGGGGGVGEDPPDGDGG